MSISSASASVSGPATTSSRRDGRLGIVAASSRQGADERRAGRARSCRSGPCRRARPASGSRMPAPSRRRRWARSGRGPSRSGPARGSIPSRSRRSSAAGRLTQTTASAAPSQRRSSRSSRRRWSAGGEGRADRLEGPGVAEVGDPGDAAPRSARPTAWTDSGGELVITQSNRSRRFSRSARRRANGAQATTSGSGHDHPAERVRPARVGVGVEQRVDPVVAVQRARAGAGGRRCGRRPPRRAPSPVAVGGGRQHRDPMAEPAQPLGHRRRPVGAGVAAGRIEVGDQEQVHPALRADELAIASA